MWSLHDRSVGVSIELLLIQASRPRSPPCHRTAWRRSCETTSFDASETFRNLGSLITWYSAMLLLTDGQKAVGNDNSEEHTVGYTARRNIRLVAYIIPPETDSSLTHKSIPKKVMDNRGPLVDVEIKIRASPVPCQRWKFSG